MRGLRGWLRLDVVALALVLTLLVSCATQKPPVVLIAPAAPLPEYSFIPIGDGGACLSPAGMQAYSREQELFFSRLEYLKKLLVDMGAKDAPK